MLALVDPLAGEGIRLEHVDLGGGLGIRYRDETPVDLAEYAAMSARFSAAAPRSLLFEPGRGWSATRACC